MESEIFDRLRQDGVQVSRGKLVCNTCQERKVTASTIKGIAKCWGCGKFWSITDTTASGEADWATILLNRLVESMQDHLVESTGAKDWLRKRRLRTDEEWLREHDLGAVPDDLRLKPMVGEARVAFEDWKESTKRRCSVLLEEGKRKGRTGKAAAQSKVDRLESLLEQEQANFTHMTEVILPSLLDPLWYDSLVYVYRNELLEVSSLNIRQYESEPDERKVMRIQPRADRRGAFGARNANFVTGTSWGSNMPGLIVVEGEHNLLSMVNALHPFDDTTHLPIIAVGGKDGADIRCIEALSGSEEALQAVPGRRPCRAPSSRRSPPRAPHPGMSR